MLFVQNKITIYYILSIILNVKSRFFVRMLFNDFTLTLAGQHIKLYILKYSDIR
jgi:hypothetical protein